MEERRGRISRFKQRLVINRQVQLSLIVHSILLAFLLAMPLYLSQFISLKYPDLFYGTHLIIVIFVLCFFIFVAAFIFSFALTNRIAGPLYRLKKHLDEMVNGAPISNLQVRKKDYFQELIDSYNQFIEKQKRG